MDTELPLFVDPTDGFMTTVDTGKPIYACDCCEEMIFEDSVVPCTECSKIVCRVVLALGTGKLILVNVPSA